MAEQATEISVASRAAVEQAGQVLVQYSFSTLGVWLATSDFGTASRDSQKAAKMSFDKVRVSAEPSVGRPTGAFVDATASAN